MMLKRRIATLAAIAGCAIGVAAPASAAATTTTAARPGVTTPDAVPRGLLPMSTSWQTPLSAIVLGYPSRTTGATPYLLETSNAGRTWRTLPAPPVRYPADNDQPDAIWAGGVIAVTDGTHIFVTRNGGRNWSADRLPGVSGNYYVDKLVIADGRLFALVTTATKAVLYSGLTQASVLSPVRGLSITGALAYGDITLVGTLQVDLGANYSTEHYWYSRDGVHFISAPLPCPASTTALLGGVRAGKVIALCNGGPSDVGPGENDKRVWVAPRLGGTFSPSGPQFVSANEQDFTTASAQDLTVATTFDLEVTFNVGKTWTSELGQNNGAFWTDLSFQSATTGVVVCSTVNNAGKEVATVYRTTNAGHTWQALSLP
jgi:hypothetical protein